MFLFEDTSLNKLPPRVQRNFIAQNKALLQIAIIFNGALIKVLTVLWSIYDTIEILQLSHEGFWNMIGTANSRAAEVNILNSGMLPGCFFFMNGQVQGYTKVAYSLL